MEKVVIFSVLIVIALFMVLVFNNGREKNNLSTLPALTVTPTPTLTPTPISQTLGSIASSPTSVPPTTAPQSIEALPKTAIIKTSKGDIELSLYPTDAPNTVANFAQKAKSGFYNNLIFHRVEDWVIQGGDPLGNGTGGGSIPVEFNNQPFVIGSLGIASRGDGVTQNDAQFFITKSDSPFLNGKYTNFGIVTKGMDVVEKIAIGDKILEIKIN